MDTLKFYDKKAAFDVKLRDQMYSLYSQFWKFLRTLPCSERSVLGDYKALSASLFNSVLYFPDNVSSLKVALQYELDDQTAIGNLHAAITKILTETLGKLAIFDRLFIRAPHLERKVTVYRGIKGEIARLISKMRKGDEVILRGLNSTAFDFNVALSFSQAENPEASVILRITLPRGTPYIMLPGQVRSQFGQMKFSKMMEEVMPPWDQTELVLNRGSKLVILGPLRRHLISPNSYEHAYRAEKYLSKVFVNVLDVRLVPSTEPLRPLPTTQALIEGIKTLEIRVKSPA